MPKVATARMRAFIAVVIAPLLALTAISAAMSLRENARIDLRNAGVAQIAQQEASVTAWIDQFRPVAPLLARDPRIVEAIADPTPDRIAAMSRELEVVNSLAGLDVTYILDAAGTTLASSN